MGFFIKIQLSLTIFKSAQLSDSVCICVLYFQTGKPLILNPAFVFRAFRFLCDGVRWFVECSIRWFIIHETQNLIVKILNISVIRNPKLRLWDQKLLSELELNR